METSSSVVQDTVYFLTGDRQPESQPFVPPRCDFPYHRLAEWGSVVTLAILVVINICVIFGNLLIIAAVLASTKLRTVTNYFVISLAVADLCVGLIVLPYSITLEVFEVWIFGDTWCHVWLAVDVWLCTSSILNLCAISVDRYLAITRPMKYRTLMSSRRAKLLIVTVWVTAFVICFPPLVGWNDLSSASSGGFVPPASGRNGTHDQNSTRGTETIDNCSHSQCALVNTKGYVIYSALGSFYIPMLFMLFFNYRIYIAAIHTSRALDRGFITTKSMKRQGGGASSSVSATASMSNTLAEQQMTLRVHRGNQSASSGSGTRPASKRSQSGSASETCIVEGIVTGRRRPGLKKDSMASAIETRSAPPSFKSGRRSTKDSKRRSSSAKSNGMQKLDSDQPQKSSSKKNMRWQARRFRTEAKATKTVGTIVGMFICCWLPFFTVYLIRAFCESCVPNLVFAIFFWLGYCNSAINPFIYALVSKDFRLAFKRILCRCCLKEGGISSLIKQVHMLTVLDDAADESVDTP